MLSERLGFLIQMYCMRIIAVLICSAFLAGCNTSPSMNEKIKSQAVNSDELLIVDCLLPGQVRKLGGDTAFLTARRPVKTSSLDCEIRGGEYVAFDRTNYATSLKVWLPDAQQGDAKAQNYVGEIYEKGLGLDPDYQAARHWYSLSAEQGYASAQINLGSLYERGLGVPRNKEVALNWYRKASGLSDAGDELHYASALEAAHVSQVERDRLQEALNSKSKELTRLHSEKESFELKLRQENKALLKEQQALFEKQELLLATQAKALNDDRKKKIQNLETALENQKTLMAEQQKRIQRYEQQVAGIDHELQEIEALSQQVKRLSPPVIEIINPALSLIRSTSKPGVLLRSAQKEQEIIGKVLAPAGLSEFLINGRTEIVDEYQLFWSTIRVNQAKVPVRLEAVDVEGQKVEFDFVIYSGGENKTYTAVEPLTANKVNDIAFGNYHAVIIGNNQYPNISNLNTAVNDAKAVDALLKNRYGFKTKLLLNASRYTILSTLNEYRSTLSEGDNLLIYYAGHGELDDTNQRGYWLPVDADEFDTTNWISNIALSDILNSLPAKHIMVVADSCYSGTMSSSSIAQLGGDLPQETKKEWLAVMSQTRARTVLTAGGVKPVLDGGGGNHSIFASAFLSSLESNQGLLEGNALYRDVLSKVTRRAKALNQNQVPEYSPIKHAGHEAGEFFFIPQSIN